MAFGYFLKSLICSCRENICDNGSHKSSLCCKKSWMQSCCCSCGFCWEQKQHQGPLQPCWACTRAWERSVKALWLCLEIPGAGQVPSHGDTCGTPRALVVAALVFHTPACPRPGHGWAVPVQRFPQCQSRLFCQGSNVTVLSTLFYGAGLPLVTQHNFLGWK